jgi:hypothetical protein
VDNVVRQGIEFDAIGRRVAYHFLRRHPSDVTDPGLAGDIVRIAACPPLQQADCHADERLQNTARLGGTQVARNSCPSH